MFQLLIASIGFIPWVIYIIITYYSTNFSQINHIESATGYGGYLFGVAIVYFAYKAYSLVTSSQKVRFSFWHILGFSLIQLLLVAIAYSSSQGSVSSPFFTKGGLSGFVLFWHSISLLLYPIFLTLLWRSVGYTVLQYIVPVWKDIVLRIRIGAEISVGLMLFATGLLGIAVFHTFSLLGLFILCVVLVALSIPGWIATYRDIVTRYVEFDQHSSDTTMVSFINPRLLTAEFAFFVISFLISVSLINAIRPMPIGWDDLGVYMNFPRIMAITGSAIEGAGTYTWQLITGSGFLWDQIAASAFYVNQLGGILSMIIITSILSVIFEQKDRKYLISLPIVLAGIYYMMPMTIFQQAKDMKLDPALMMVSVSAFGVLWYALRENISKNIFYILIAVAGFIVGIAFGIKFTTLILIIASLSLIAYRTLGIFGFIGFFFIFISIFTGANLWTKMNVWMPTENVELIRNIAMIAGALGIVSILIGIGQQGFEKFRVWIVANLVFILGIALALTPWFIKNGYEARVFTSQQKGGTIDSLLGGFGGILNLDSYSAIYTKDEYAAKRKAQQASSITSDGKSQNEDFSRYFGQESGLNNYLKLPANLTFQKNQSGEFTDITYIFLAFFPAILLFVGGRQYGKGKWTKLVFPVLVSLSIILMLSFYFIRDTKLELTQLMGNITLPLGYAFIVGGILFAIVTAHYTISDDETGSRIKDIFIVLMVYGFLFLISAFGIVWYGVFVYFLFLSIIGLAALGFVAYTDREDENLISIKIILSSLFFLFIVVYIIRSAFPHGWNNLISAGMNEYKYNKLDQNESIFTYRGDYITPIATMNVVDPNGIVQRAAGLAKSSPMKKILTSDRLASMSPSDLHQVLLYFISQIENGKNIEDKIAVEKDIDAIGHELYSSILAPHGNDINKKGIYRIGTFMTYLINENRKRYLDDSLIFDFDTFFYDPIPENTIDRMKKVGLGYLLTDLNAATIDRDPRRALTTRFEHLLLTMRAKNLKLVDTDNLCLQVALNEYNAGRLQKDTEFIDIAGTNYESYRGESYISRNQKQANCAKYVINILNNTSQSGGVIPDYLAPLQSALLNAKTQEDQQNVLAQSLGQSYFALFEIIDIPTPIKDTTLSSSGAVTQTGSVNQQR